MKPLELNMEIFERMLAGYGPRGWWPARTRFEVIAGAILAQNVSWENAKQAVDSLKNENMLSPKVLNETDAGALAEKIKSSRFFFQKALKLKNFCAHLEREYGGSLNSLFKVDMESLREELLSLKGIGPETADCILLYAGKKLSFVSDAYTARFLDRYGIIAKGCYEEIRRYFMENLPADLYIYKEFHALIVHHGNTMCRVKPFCGECPVRKLSVGSGCERAGKEET